MEPTKIIAVAGNPNVGKSTIFNCLTGLKQHTGNWPGKTVTYAQGAYDYSGQRYTLIDLPGAYSLVAHSAEEEITRDYIRRRQADAIIVVCDAVCLERNLNLVLQILEDNSSVVVCINLLDEAAKKQIQINLPELSRLLGVPVVGTSARQGQGLTELMAAVHELVHNQVRDNSPAIPVSTAQQTINDNTASASDQAVYYVQQAENIARAVISYANPNYDRKDRWLDSWITGRLTGFPLMLLLLAFVFWLTIWGANYPSQWLSQFLFSLEIPLFRLCQWLGLHQSLQNMLVLGCYRTLAWVVSVMLPPMAIFFPLFTLLEDVGYLPRVAFNLDHYFKKSCACGKQALTMTMGFGCNAAGVIGCRIIDSPRERLIAILTNSFVPCNGRFPTLIVLLTLFFVYDASLSPWRLALQLAFMMTGFITLSILVTLATSRVLSATLLRGLPSSFTLELPPYRRPQVGQVILRSILDRTLFVLGRAMISAAPAGLLIWLLANLQVDSLSLLRHITNFLNPFAYYLGLDGVILFAFILGFPANEIVLPIVIMAYLSNGSLSAIQDIEQISSLFRANDWTWLTALCTMLFSLFHFPCATTCLTIRKETQSRRWTLFAWLLPTTIGIFICMTVAALVRLITGI